MEERMISMRRAESLREALEQDIVTGTLAPGEKLDEQVLAQRFGVSRTPVREALMQLSTSGLIALHPRRGAFVARFSIGEIVERFEVMAALEGMCAALAARRITAQQQADLVSAHESCSEDAAGVDSDAYYYANEKFHHQLYLSCQNTYLAGQARDLHSRLQPYRRLQLKARSRVSASFAEHQAILEAVLAGDSGEAERRAKAHILIQGERLADFIAMFEGH